ncbi:MAG: 3-deoxy-D-manno-octulosonic acid transferase, partial [Alphaproteobacteria bacterium]|nr:3-deoxy-D-manno-octulosonic acid transferase [Alphaproteobacteria bacterium]
MAESAASAGRPGGLALAAYRLGTRALTPCLPAYLRRRLARGREMPDRWREKLGFASLPRPDAPLVWLHAVGLGEVLALRGLIAALSQARGDLEFLVTSSARSSAEVIARNLPPRTRHQFLPLDTPRFAARFLDHWRPDLSIWAEQDFWPGLVAETHARGIPLALVNARMDAASLAARRRGRALFSPLYACFAYLGAQDEGSARNLAGLGAPGVSVHPSLKLFAPPLAADPEAGAALKAALGGRPLWLCASSHPADEKIAIAAQKRLLKARPDTLLTLVPRDPERRAEIAAKLHAAGLHAARRGAGALPGAECQVYLADTLGELGLLYALAPAALIGGTFSDVEG